MEDEDEVLYELDDFAMAQLPRHLQENMREIQMERFSRLSAQNPNLEILANPHRMHANRRHTTNEYSTHPPDEISLPSYEAPEAKKRETGYYHGRYVDAR
ncbi:hypothetical protein DTO271D3_8786 [Paecilomyces variotii]|nr:hypothetical protein DTO271D3_8786 [Paecilomyces variotii]